MTDHSFIQNTNSKGHHLKGTRRVIRVISRSIARVFKNWQRHKAKVALERLDDRLLEDLGISRNDIPEVVAGLFLEDETPAHMTMRGNASDKSRSTHLR